MDDKIKANIDEYFEILKEKLEVKNIKKAIVEFGDDEVALEYFEDKLEDIGYMVNDAEEFLGTTILDLDEDDE